MKFYCSANKTIFRITLSIAFITTMSGCASVDFGFGEPEPVEIEQKQLDIVPTDGTKTVEDETNLTPEQLRIVELNAKPNLYFAGSPFPPEAAKIVFQQALDAKQQGDFARAQTLFNQVTIDFPNLSGPYMQLGDLVLIQHEAKTNPTEEEFQLALSSAANFYRQAITANQHNYFAHNRLAKVYRQQGQFELAESHYKQAIDSWPAFDIAYLNLGILYDLYLGKKVLALRQYETYQGLQVSPGRKVSGWIADMKRQIARADR